MSVTIRKFEPKVGTVAPSTGRPGTEAERKQDLIARAYRMAFDENDPPPPEKACLFLGADHPVGARGNLVGIQGQAKAGKSAVVSAILGAAIRRNFVAEGDLFGFEWQGPADGAIIHLDTEQSPADWHALVRRAIARAGLPNPPERLVSIPAVTFTRAERLDLLEGMLEREHEKRGAVDLVIVDGVADLCKSPNDEAESLELVSKIHALCHKFDCVLVAVLHENPNSENGKTRGHLGSELTRKAFANLRIDKDADSMVSTIYGTQMRKRDLPKNQGFCFAWDDGLGMHAFQGRHSGLKAAKREEKQVTEARELWEPIYRKARANGTEKACPVLGVDEALELIRDTNGTGAPPKRDTLKKWMQRAEVLGVLRKAERGKWTLIPNGTNGTQSGHREKH